MKYEAVYGNQSLFDGAPEDAEYAGWFCQEVRWYMILNGKILFSDGGSWCTSDNPYLSADIAAMRRIIHTPVWTVVDQKAGRLPEVGCAVINTDHSISLYVLCKVIYVDDEVVIVYNGELSQTYSHEAFLVTFNPIESPEEKAARLRLEWCTKAMDYSTVQELHDALLTGDLPVPVKG